MAIAVVAAVVETVRVAVPTPPETEIAPKLHFGAGVADGEMLLQLKVTFVGSNPPVGEMVTVEVLEEPALTEAGERADADRVKLGEAGEFTVWLTAEETAPR